MMKYTYANMSERHDIFVILKYWGLMYDHHWESPLGITTGNYNMEFIMI